MSDNGKRVLLVEDDRFLRRACETSLKQQGFTVITATDGEEGLQAARTQSPDLILLDLLMPKLSGIDMLKMLKAEAETRNIPVLVLTNSSREDALQQIMSAGAAGYKVKANLSLQELGQQVKQLLEG